MIIKYLCEVLATGGNIVLYHDEKADFWFLPVPTLLKKGLLSNHFSSIRDVESAIGSDLLILKEINGR